ncbi:MAG TPA: glycosyltransferase family 25 protein [Polyangiaceae bacterium]|nr:glycosyltransferase family 25 protein [Polyangiaceae bacterium]
MSRTLVEVISMASALERRAEFAAAAAATGSRFTFVDAATSAPLGVPHDPRAATRRFGRPLTPAEVGCFASHHAAWQRLLDGGDEQRIVLEDDVMVDWPALDGLARADFSALGLDFIRFYSTHPFRYSPVITRFSSPHRHLVRARGMFLGSQGYLFTRRAAQAFVAGARAITMPVDWYLGRYWEFGFPNYCLFPFPVIERETVSHIGHRPETKSARAADQAALWLGRARDRLAREWCDRVRLRGLPFGRTPDFGPTFLERFGRPLEVLSK